MLAGPFEQASIEDFGVSTVSMSRTFMGMQGAIPLMKASVAEHQARPSIINISSIYGQIAGGVMRLQRQQRGDQDAPRRWP